MKILNGRMRMIWIRISLRLFFIVVYVYTLDLQKIIMIFLKYDFGLSITILNNKYSNINQIEPIVGSFWFSVGRIQHLTLVFFFAFPLNRSFFIEYDLWLWNWGKSRIRKRIYHIVLVYIFTSQLSCFMENYC